MLISMLDSSLGAAVTVAITSNVTTPAPVLPVFPNMNLAAVQKELPKPPKSDVGPPKSDGSATFGVGVTSAANVPAPPTPSAGTAAADGKGKLKAVSAKIVPVVIPDDTDHGTSLMLSLPANMTQNLGKGNQPIVLVLQPQA